MTEPDWIGWPPPWWLLVLEVGLIALAVALVVT